MTDIFEDHLGGRVRLANGDSRDVLKALPDNSIDSVVTDPPYALVSIVKRFGGANSAPVKVDDINASNDLKAAYARASAGFMGKTWDTGETAFAVEFWAEVMRVLKPGGHVVAASGTRTYHRLAVAIEDAGFEIRDQIMWNYASGFPKSHNVVKRLMDTGLACSCSKTILSSHYVSDENLHDLRVALDTHDSLSTQERDMQPGVCGQDHIGEKVGQEKASIGIAGDGNDALRGVRCGSVAECKAHCEGGETSLLETVQRSPARRGVGDARPQGRIGAQDNAGHADGKESGMEGRRDDEAAARELHGSPICEGTAMGAADGASGRLHNGASSDDGEDVRLSADAGGNGASSRPRPIQQRAGESGIVADERGPQAWGGWPVCGGCGKPVVPEGYGTALKPAVEPWVLARKPLVGTVAGNVLAHGTGALNIDGCRVGNGGGTATIKGDAPTKTVHAYGDGLGAQGGTIERVEGLGRWPANVIHDGSDEVVGAFPGARSAGAYDKAPAGIGYMGGASGGVGAMYDDSGSAARFFYSAKADALDRVGSKHPTVKPVDLMQYLCRLITPPGGIVLDPFAGSGSTGEAAWREGFQCVLIEREADYAQDIRDRLALASAGIATKKRAIAVKKSSGEELGGLFA